MTTNKLHLMLDLETLSLRSNAAVIGIGVARVFPGSEVRKVFDELISPSKLSIVDSHFHVDEKIIAWHNANTQALNRAYMDGEDGGYVINKFTSCLALLAQQQPLMIWCQGTDFDIPIITNYLQVYGLTAPWKYSNVRDLRTLAALFPAQKPAGADHTAYADAAAQAGLLENICVQHNIKLE